jgi:hypothetical protein
MRLSDLLRFNLQGTVFIFEIAQTITEKLLYLLKKYFGASTIFAKHEFAFYLIIVRDKVVRLFVFNSLRFNLQKAIFTFEIAQTITEIYRAFK